MAAATHRTGKGLQPADGALMGVCCTGPRVPDSGYVTRRALCSHPCQLPFSRQECAGHLMRVCCVRVSTHTGVPGAGPTKWHPVA